MQAYGIQKLLDSTRRAWQTTLKERMKAQREWAQIERREAVLKRTKKMIVDAQDGYNLAFDVHAKNPRVLGELKAHWTPERVMTKDKAFLKLCEALKDPSTWAMLSRQQRRFINKAIDYLPIATQKGLGR